MRSSNDFSQEEIDWNVNKLAAHSLKDWWILAHGVSAHNFLELTFFDSLGCWSREDSVGDECVHFCGTSTFQLSGCFAKSSRGVGHIIDDDANFVLDISNNGHGFNFVSLFSFFVHHCHRNLSFKSMELEVLLKWGCSFYSSSVRGDDTDIRFISRNLFQEVIDSSESSFIIFKACFRGNWSCDSRGVHVQSNNLISAHEFKNLSHVRARNRIGPILILSLLPGITIVWDDACDVGSACSFASWDCKEQLHHVIVDWPGSALDDVDFFAFHRLVNIDMGLSVGKSYHFSFAKWLFKVLSHRCCKFWVWTTPDDKDLSFVTQSFLSFRSCVWV